MPSPSTISLIMRKTVFFIVLAWLFYAVLTLITPSVTATTRYGLSFAQLEFIRITFLIPFLFIWLAAGYAVARFYKYSTLLKGSPESKGFSQIAEGLLLLLLALILPSFISIAGAFDPQDTDIQKLVTITRNYITIILYMTSFWQLWQGSKNLLATIQNPEQLNASIRKYVYWFITILGIAYIATIFQNQFRTHSSDPLIRSTYFIPDWLIIVSIVIPYVLIWLWGCLAIVNFREFSKTVPGIVYKKSFSYTANGLIAIISLSITLQFLSQLTGFFGKASVGVILGLIYLILLIMAAGYFYIARGVRALSAIEEI